MAADSLYSRAFGRPNDPAIIFLHGGPGYNAASFEITTAQRLADSGFYVIVYDQRGAGRSSKLKGEYTLEEAFADLSSLYDKHGFRKASLIGHSWGGTLGILYAEKYPKRVSKLVLTGSPLSYQHGFRTMLRRCTEYYISKNDTLGLQMMDAARKLDTSNLFYASALFMHAQKCGLYNASVRTDESTALREKIKAAQLWRLMQDMKQAPVMGFYKSIKYTTLDLTTALLQVAKQTKVFGIYGEEDGLFDEAHLSNISSIIGIDNFLLLQSASHNTFIDQPTRFTSALVSALR